jgi:hypothetical protein
LPTETFRAREERVHVGTVPLPESSTISGRIMQEKRVIFDNVSNFCASAAIVCAPRGRFDSDPEQ